MLYTVCATLPSSSWVSFNFFVVNRVRRTALALARAQTPEPDLFVVELAALLHDVLDKKYVSAAEAADPHGFFRPLFERVAPHVDLISDGRAHLVGVSSTERDLLSNDWVPEK